MKKILFSLMALVTCASASAQYYYQDANNVDMLRHAKQTAPERREIVVPKTLNGYNVYKADLHIHSIFSDGHVTPEFRVREAWYEGLDILAITEHIEGRSFEQKMLDYLVGYVGEDAEAVNSRIVNTPADERGILADLNHAARLAKKSAESYGLLVIPGTEISRDPTKIGHYNALFTTDVNAIYDPDPEQSIRKARAQGALIMQNHPGWRRKEITYMDFEKDVYGKGLIDGIEVMNGSGVHIEALTRAAEHNLFVTSTTDAHDTNYERYGLNNAVRNVTFIMAEEKTLESVKEALLNHMTIAYSFGTFAGDKTLLVDFFKASVPCEVIRVDAKGRKTVKMTNMTSLPFLLDFGGNPILLDPFSSITRSAGAKGVIKFKVANMWHARDQHPEVVLEF